MPRRAVLIFADELHVDLARRSLPNAAQPLLRFALQAEISCAVDIHLFTSAPSARGAGPCIHRQTGRTFAARFENAVEQIAQLGYGEIVAIGRDCPGLRASDIERAFAELEAKKLVLGPDHRGGCYLIAFRAADRGLLRGVRWKRNTDCAQLRDRCRDSHVFLLPVKPDLDSWADLQVLAGSDDPLGRLASYLDEVFSGIGARLVRLISIASQLMRVRQQMPPPALAA